MWNGIEEYTISDSKETDLRNSFYAEYKTKNIKVKKIQIAAIQRRLEMTNNRVSNLYTKLSVINAVITTIIVNHTQTTDFSEKIVFAFLNINGIHTFFECKNIVLIVFLYRLFKLIGLVYLSLLGQYYSYSTYKDLKCIEKYREANDFNAWQIYFDWQSSMKRAKLLNVYIEQLLKNAGIVGVLFILLEILLK